MYRPLDERWLDELDRQLRDPFVIDDPSMGTLQLAHRVHAVRQLRGTGRDRVVRAMMREVAGMAAIYPHRFDLLALTRAMYGDLDQVIASRDSEATISCAIPVAPQRVALTA